MISSVMTAVGYIVTFGFGCAIAAVITFCLVQYLALVFKLHYHICKADVFKPQFKRKTAYKVQFFFYCLFNYEFFITKFMFRDLEYRFIKCSLKVNSEKIIPDVSIKVFEDE